jgi:hypothetical protein
MLNICGVIGKFGNGLICGMIGMIGCVASESDLESPMKHVQINLSR